MIDCQTDIKIKQVKQQLVPMLRLMQTTLFGFRVLLFNSSQLGTNNNQNEYKYLTVFGLHKTSFTGFSQTSLRLLLTWAVKMAENANFSTEENDECLPNFVIFGENELLEVSDKLDDDEISLFVEENRNLYATELTSIFQCLK